MAAGTGLDGARLWQWTAGRRVLAAFGCGKLAHGCHRAANPAKWAAVSGETADKTRYAAGCGREEGNWRRQTPPHPPQRFDDDDVSGLLAA
ncbi:MAG: hypothetical protein J0L63_10195 [Anaerolineae bacterium]|nr:hypothetical protein [Anaerolineae bacterium]